MSPTKHETTGRAAEVGAASCPLMTGGGSEAPWVTAGDPIGSHAGCTAAWQSQHPASKGFSFWAWRNLKAAEQAGMCTFTICWVKWCLVRFHFGLPPRPACQTPTLLPVDCWLPLEKGCPVDIPHWLIGQMLEQGCGDIPVAYLYLQRFQEKRFRDHTIISHSPKNGACFPLRERLCIDRQRFLKAHKGKRISKIFFPATANICCVLLWIIHY